jgi:hypothetical protein
MSSSGSGKKPAAAPAVMDRVRALIDQGREAQVRTAHGSWRSVVAVYSDQTLGTVRAEHLGGRFTILQAGRIVDIRYGQSADGSPDDLPRQAIRKDHEVRSRRAA